MRSSCSFANQCWRSQSNSEKSPDTNTQTPHIFVRHFGEISCLDMLRLSDSRPQWQSHGAYDAQDEFGLLRFMKKLSSRNRKTKPKYVSKDCTSTRESISTNGWRRILQCCPTPELKSLNCGIYMLIWDNVAWSINTTPYRQIVGFPVLKMFSHPWNQMARLWLLPHWTMIYFRNAVG